ncbi:MAG: hypothetical protein ACLQEQ_09230 [Nitrososphaerales archaeon]
MDIEAVFAYGLFGPDLKELAMRVYVVCLSGEILVAEAMSGFGKTAAFLSGTLTHQSLGFRG